MKKITLLFFAFFLSFSVYSQFPNPGIEGFENTAGPEAIPSTIWNLGTGVTGNQWAVFDNGIGTGRWTINSTVVAPPFPIVYQGVNSGYMNRVQAGGPNITTENYLATPRVTIPANGQLRFWTRSFTLGNQGTFYDIKIAPATANQTSPAAYTTTLVTYTEDQLTLDPLGVQNPYNVYTEKIINFPASMVGNQYYIAFIRRNTQQVGTTIDGDRWLIDAIQLNERCLDPTAPTTAGIFSGSANLTWTNPSGATSWEIEILPAATAVTGFGITYSGALPYPATTTAFGSPLTQTPLAPNTAYKYRVRAICPGNIPSDWSPVHNFTTTTAPPVCGGNYVDPGGPTANYANNITAANGTTVICPTNPGDLVTVTFTSFTTQANLDTLSIYDGSVVTPSALLGTFSGTALPPSFTSSAANGCLTFVFVTNATVTAAGWVANVTCAPPPPCPKPTALTGITITPTSINLGWTNIGPGTTWQYIILPTGSPAPAIGTIGTAAPTNPFLITGLTSGTCYNVYVRSDCSSTSNGLSAWSNVYAFCTTVAPPVCGGNYVDSGGPTGNYAANTNSTVNICPTTPGDIVTVTFTALAIENNFDFIRIYDGPTAASPLIATLTGSPGIMPPPFTATSVSGCLTFVFTSDASGQLAGWLANVTCTTPPACQQPTALASSAVLSNTATLSWANVGAATAWQVIALPCTAPAPNASTTGWTAVPGPATTHTFTGLNAATCYNLYVRGNCSSTSNGVSLWSGPIAITTQVAPPICGGNFVDVGGTTGNYAANSNSTVTICPTVPGEQVTVTFTSFNTEASWDGLYVYDGNTVTPAALLPSTNGPGFGQLTTPGAYWGNLNTNLPGPFTSSALNGCLTFVFISDGVINNPGWLANITCGPPPTCPKPTAVTVASVTQTSATVSWTETGTATQWHVLILPATAPAPNAGTPGWQTANATTFLYTPLPAGSQFKVYVRSFCSSSDISLWSSPATFNLPPISTSTTLYNTTQLVEDVLFNSTCATISNITSSTGNNFGSTNGIGYFNQNGSSFPFSQGIILMTGDVTRAPGPNTEGLGDGAATWPGDAQLFNYIQGLGIDPLLTSYNNATRLEFDFVPLINNISFDFIFASEEYGVFQCDFSDAFAFFLTNNTTGVTTNLAVLPSSTIPISVVTIRNQLYNAGCASANPQYFANFYDPNGPQAQGAPIDFNGETVALTASSAVVPGTQYHIKLVIADRNDSAFDSAVFLKGGSFNIGNVELGNNLLEATNNALCDNATYTIQSGLDATQYTFSWTFNGNLIPNQNGPNLTVTQEGIYSINATFINTTCTATDTITIEFYDPVASGTPNNMTICNNSGFGQFNLSLNTPSALGSLVATSYTVTYYATNADALAEVNALPNLYANVVQFLQTIYVRVEDNLTACFTVKPFNLVVQDLTPLFTITPNFFLCNGTSGTITLTPTNYNNADATYSWTLNGNVLPDTSNQITVSQNGTYEVTVNNQGCTNTGQTTVTVVPIPVPDNPSPVTVCGSYTLPALITGSYYTQTGGPIGSGALIAAGTIITASQTLFVYAESGTTPNCTAETSFLITINPVVTTVFSAIGPICVNTNAPLLPIVSDNGGITGSWSPTAIDTSTVGTSIYTFTPDAGQCASVASLNITINATSIVPTFNTIAPICLNGSAPILPTASNDITPINGTWSPSTIDTSVIGTTTYIFTPVIGQCAVTTQLSVSILAPSQASFTQIGPLCQGSTAPVLPNSFGNNITGTWNPSIVDTTVPGTSTYTFTPNAGQCATGTTMSITIHPTPVLAAVNSVTVCDSYTLPTLQIGNYFTSPNGVGPISNLTLTTSQLVYVYAQSGTTPNCTDQDSFQVNITTSPQFTIEGGCDGGVYVLEVANTNFNTDTVTYNWSGPGTIQNNGTPSIVVTTPGNYTCIITVPNSANGCSTTVPFNATDISCQFPQGISPNGDGLNDTLDLSGFNVSKLSIFNRYGKTVYSRGDYRNEWGGQTDSGNELPDGTYYYVMERKDGGETKSGWVFINREIR